MLYRQFVHIQQRTDKLQVLIRHFVAAEVLQNIRFP